jgi:hypothetical protein
MIGLVCFALTVLASPFKSKSRLEAENAVLRHQLIVLRQRVRDRVQPTDRDRWFLVPTMIHPNLAAADLRRPDDVYAKVLA